MPAGQTIVRRARWLGGAVVDRVVHRWYGGYLLRRIQRPGTARLRGRVFATEPEVLHPVHFRSTGVLVDALAARDLRGKTFLDMGTGSGAVGVFAAARGAVVTACDINPRAVALARRNFDRNRVTGEIVESDLFAALGDRTFDVICFNLPYYDGEPRTPLEQALYGGAGLRTIRAFASAAARAVAPAGQIVTLYAEGCDVAAIRASFDDARLVVADERVVRRLFERFHVVTFQAGA